MFCTNCSSPYAAPYESLACPSNSGLVSGSIPCAPTLNPALPPACQDGISPYPVQNSAISSPPLIPGSVPPTTRPPPPQASYRYVSQLPVDQYGFQGPNGSVICGMKPLYSVPAQSMWNPAPNCPPTETKLASNVGNYDNYQSNFSVSNPITNRTLPTLAALFCPENIEYIKTTISDMLTKTFGFPIGIEDTPAFRQTINDVAIDNPRWMYDVQQGLPLLNNVIIQREFGVHQVALRQQLLYQKYIIEQNRQKFMPYGSSDHVVKGETVNDSSSYTLNQPVPISYECFLTQANLRCKGKSQCH
jgi:hypothetical protein